ncbi:MAG TPA: hypothetical protein HPP41_00170 [Deltaproteobacteria bacterium]|nr:hypothetical protein [Deltaproteobacteria bacterium]
MLKEVKGLSSDRTVWFLVGAVFLCVLLVLGAVFNHEREKPKSPQALAAAAFNQTFTVKEWKPGMGPKPFMYHPAGFNSLAWRPLPTRPVAGLQWNPVVRPAPLRPGLP